MENNKNITLFIRKRPFLKGENSNKVPIDFCNKKIHIYQQKKKVTNDTYVEKKTYNFNNLINEKITNKEFSKNFYTSKNFNFDKCNNYTIYTFGQTGAGKTYTLFGDENNNTCGIIKYLCEYLYSFDIPSISLSSVEIYNNYIYDLFQDKKKINCLEDAKGFINVTNLSSYDVNSIEELNNYIEIIKDLRRVGITSYNNQSSRSHMIVFLSFIMNGKLNYITIIDLAGSERASDSIYQNKSLYRENKEINTSLLCLKECFVSLKHRKRIPYRSTKLTMFLKDSFFGKSKTFIIFNISPYDKHLSYTFNTLKYASDIEKLGITIKNINNPDIWKQNTSLIRRKNNQKRLLEIKREREKKLKELKQIEEQKKKKKYRTDYITMIKNNILESIKIGENEIKLYKNICNFDKTNDNNITDIYKEWKNIYSNRLNLSNKMPYIEDKKKYNNKK